MRLKQLMASSLPRKKKQKQQQQTTEQSQTLNNSTLRPAPLSPRNPIVSDFTNSPPKERGSQNVTLRKTQNGEEIRTSGEKLSPTSKNDHLNINFNVASEDGKCGCYKHINPVFSPESRDGKVFTFAGDSNFNSLPKPRTRIKTNPWLPSPRQTPVTSPLTSTSSSPAYSPTEDKLFDESESIMASLKECNKDKLFNFDSSSSNSMNIQTAAQKRPRSDSGSGSMLSSDTDSVLMRSISSETDNSITANERPRFPSFLDDVTCAKSSCEGLDANDVEDILDRQHIEARISFEYEEAFESQMEAPVGKIIGSRDSLTDDYGSNEEVYGSSMNELRYKLLNPKKKSLKYLQTLKNPDDDSGTDDTLCDEFTPVFRTKPRRRHRHWKDDKYDASCDGTDSSCDLFDSDKENGRQTKLGVQDADDHNLSIDSAFESGGYSLKSFSSSEGRSIGDIRLSLQDKVNVLRKEKHIVDEKIRQAQEEERLRLQEKMRFQKQLTQHRKQILLRTLQDLKTKLETQSQRLQTSYTKVLSIQQHAAQTKNKPMSHVRGVPIGVATADPREAPF